MDCNKCVYSDRCKHPNLNKPACLMFSRYEKALSMAKVPKKYKSCSVDNLPIEKENPTAYKLITKYCNTAFVQVTENNYSLYLYSKPSKDNPLGTGTGKTTSACTIINSFVKDYVWNTMMLRMSTPWIPALFVRCSDFQNIYNAQFREQSGASNEYYAYKNNMKTCRLLVLDDVAIRSCTEAFVNELYEVINHRCVEELATIYTSNVPLDDIGGLLDYRIESRMKEDCYKVAFTGKDNRGC